MDLPIDVLMQICARLGDKTLRAISKTRLWSVVRLFANRPHFWKLRIEHLTLTSIECKTERDWKLIFRYLNTIVDRERRVRMAIELDQFYDFNLEEYARRIELVYASKCGNIDGVRVLLQIPTLDPAANNRLAIRRAIDSRYLDVAKLLLDSAIERRARDIDAEVLKTEEYIDMNQRDNILDVRSKRSHTIICVYTICTVFLAISFFTVVWIVALR